MIAAIILAGGASQRMGTPKALLKFRDATFLETILEAGLAAGLQPRVVVLGYDANKILQELTLDHVTVVRSDDLAAGPIGSIRTGIGTILNHAVDAAVVWHVDQPHVRLDTVRALTDRFRAAQAPILIPTYRGRRGHPVLFARGVFDELLAAPDREGAKAVVHAHPGRVIEVPVEDPAVLEDIDTPEAYQALLKRLDAGRA